MTLRMPKRTGIIKQNNLRLDLRETSQQSRTVRYWNAFHWRMTRRNNSFCGTVVLRLEQGSESPVGLVKTQSPGPTCSVADSTRLGWCLGINTYVSDRFPGDADAGLYTIL